MKVLLDEDVPIRLRHHFPSPGDVETVEYRGWKGLKNGELLRVAQEYFDVIVTLDDNLPDQQPLQQFDLAVVILRPQNKTLEELAALVPELDRVFLEIRPGNAVRIYPTSQDHV